MARQDRAPVTATGEGESVPLYVRIMGDRFAALPAEVREAHSVTGQLLLVGEAEVRRGAGLLPRLIGSIMGFPPAAEKVPVAVRMEESKCGEIWHRDFGGTGFSSRLSQFQSLVVERFGLVRIGMELRSEPDGLSMPIRRWWIGPVPLPLALAPRSLARERARDGRFHFDVPISLPLVGLLVHYRGWLEPAKA